jgi:excisionase family DNA binding protein
MSERLLTSAELAGILGFATGTVLDWFERGELPGFRIGGRLRFRESEVLAWLETKRTGTGGEARTAPSKCPPRSVVSLTRTVPLEGGEDNA